MPYSYPQRLSAIKFAFETHARLVSHNGEGDVTSKFLKTYALRLQPRKFTHAADWLLQSSKVSISSTLQTGEEKRTKVLDCLLEIAYKVVISSHNSSQRPTYL